VHQGDAQDYPTIGEEQLMVWDGEYVLSNKCNSSVSASATSLDPILSRTLSSLLANDKFTVVTSNVTQLARS
jgi:hypothetical protein